MNNGESIEVKIAKIQERVTSDRKNHAIQFQNISSQLDYIVNKLDHKSAELEADRLQIALLIPKIEDSINISNENKIKLNDYKKKMILWELFQEWKHIPFWTFISLFIVVTWKQLIVLFNSFLDKFTGS